MKSDRNMLRSFGFDFQECVQYLKSDIYKIVNVYLLIYFFLNVSARRRTASNTTRRSRKLHGPDFLTDGTTSFEQNRRNVIKNQRIRVIH